MSKLQELIQELCPDGVEYRTLEDIGSFFGGLTGKSKEDFKNGNAKFITYRNVYSNPSLSMDIEDKVKIADDEKQHIVRYGDILFTAIPKKVSTVTIHFSSIFRCLSFQMVRTAVILPIRLSATKTALTLR